ncbi:MAG: transposase [Chloroflexi bacterium]|nr:transposase [Chloroflexota bacterium]
MLDSWRTEYNTHHPHSALGYITPDALANEYGQRIPTSTGA